MPLTVFQSLPIDGIVIVSSPQDLVQMIVKKAYNMAKMMNVPVLGLVENYSYVKCPDCGKAIYVFGESKVRRGSSRGTGSGYGQDAFRPGDGGGRRCRSVCRRG